MTRHFQQQPDYPPTILHALLAYRQTEGLIGSLIHLLELTLPVPDHTTLSRRAAILEVPRPRSSHHADPVHLLVDSTGLKLCGPGEWLVEKHGTKARRSWRKFVWGVRCQVLNVDAVSFLILTRVYSSQTAVQRTTT